MVSQILSFLPKKKLIAEAKYSPSATLKLIIVCRKYTYVSISPGFIVVWYTLKKSLKWVPMVQKIVELKLKFGDTCQYIKVIIVRRKKLIVESYMFLNRNNFQKKKLILTLGAGKLLVSH